MTRRLMPIEAVVPIMIFTTEVTTMGHCILCLSAIIEHAQYYVASNIGPEIISVLEQNLGHEISQDGIICGPCFAKCNIASTSPSEVKHEVLTLPPETNVCVCCRSSLFRRRSQMLEDGPQRQLILERISPRTIPDGSRVCYACWVYAQKILQAQGIISTPVVNTNVCVWCKVSLAKRRRHSIPEGPERDEIVQRIYPREIPPGGLVCYACWVSARRSVQQARSRNEKIEELPEPGPSHSHSKDVCVWCGTSLFRRHTHILTGLERDEVAAKIHPRELPQHALVCSNCFVRTQENVQIQRGHLINVSTSINDSTMTLDNFCHTTNSSSRCFVPGCHNPERLIVPEYLKIRILKSKKIFIMDNSRICAEHKSVFNWDFLDRSQFSTTFTKVELESMLSLSIKDIELNIDFENFEQMNDNLFKYWTGLDKERYLHVLNIISSAFSSREKPKTALGVYLIKVRTGDSHERISSLLNISKASVSRFLDKIKEALDSLSVPFPLGDLNHIRRDPLQ